MLSKKRLINAMMVVGAPIAFSLMTGCTAVTGHSKNVKEVDAQLVSGTCDLKKLDEKIQDGDDLVFNGVQAASIARQCEDFTKSNSYFDKVELTYKEDVDKDNALNNTFESLKSIVANSNTNDYEGNYYEKIMINTYKGLNYLALNDRANARIEFNRALDRQRRAKEYFEAEIAEKQNDKKENSAITNMDQTNNVINENFSDLFADFEAYPDFVNPFTTYLSGLFFMLDGDASKARDFMKEAMAMLPENTQVKEDFELSEEILNSGGKMNKKYAWVIYENGQGMVKDEVRIDIPLFLISSKTLYTGIALPKLKARSSSYSHLNVSGEDTQLVVDMDRVMKAEFQKRLPIVASEAVASAITKTLATKELQDRGGLIGGLLGAAYHAATNKADVRSWSALPKNFQAVRVEIDDKPIKILSDSGNEIATVDASKANNAIIYVRSMMPGNDKVQPIFF